jgi:hypothetical protein
MSAPFSMNFSDKNPMMQHLFQVWMQPVYGRLNLEGKKVLWALLSVIPLLVIVIYLLASFSSSAKISLVPLALAALIGLVTDVVLILLFWFITLSSSMVLQYSPANASLVPHLKRHLQWALAIPIVLLAIIPAAAVAYKSTEFAALTWLICVMSMLMLTAMFRNKWMVFVIAAIAQLPIFLRGINIPFDVLKSANQSILLIPFGLLMIVLFLHWIFAKGEHLFKRREQIVRVQEVMQGNAKRDFSGVLIILLPYYLRLLKQRLQRRDNAGQLLPFVLGPQAHWSSIFLQTLGIATLMGLYFFVLVAKDTSATDNSLLIFLPLLGFFLMPIAYIAAIQISLYQSRGAQSLLSISPAVTSNRMQTQVLLRYVMRQYFILMSLLLFITVFVCEWMTTRVEIRNTIYLACFSMLPLSISLIRNYAQMQSVLDIRMARILLSWFALFSVLLAIVNFVPMITYWMLCALITLFTAVLLFSRWNKLMRVDAVFPAGRAV